MILVCQWFESTESVLISSIAHPVQRGITSQYWDYGNLYWASTGLIVNFHLGSVEDVDGRPEQGKSSNTSRSLLNAPQAEINNRTNVDPTLDTNFWLSESDCRPTVEMITMYCAGTTPVSKVVSILVTNIFSTLAVNISKILVIYFYY